LGQGGICARAFDWDLAPQIALGPAVVEQRKQAGHMTAPDYLAPTSKNPLPKGSRPHMTQCMDRLLFGILSGCVLNAYDNFSAGFADHKPAR